MDAATNLNHIDLAEKRSSEPRWRVWTGWALSALPILMMLLSASMKLSHDPKMLGPWTAKYGFAESVLIPIAIVELTCVVLYAVPRTAVLGGVLLSGYLGGAIATHVRVAEPFVIPLALGVLAWAGLFLRDERVRELLPFRAVAPRT